MPPDGQPGRRRSGSHAGPVVSSGLLFASGAAALVYQVLWVREIGLLVGSTAQAASITIAVFFAGIAAGGWWWGRRSSRVGSALGTFGGLELGVAATALGYFALAGLYRAAYPSVHGAVAASAAAEAAVVAVVAVLVLFPASFLMGGTLPAMGQHLVRHEHHLATTGTLLYAVNTAGAATGAVAAGFVLPAWLGFRTTYLLAVGVDLVVGLTALVLARRAAGASVSVRTAGQVIEAARTATAAARARPVIHRRVVAFVAVGSGFATLAIEVLWTRLFAQVLQNSAQTYATVLVTFLLALAVGGVIANLCSRLRGVDPAEVLAALLVIGGLAVAGSLWLFHRLTDGGASLGGDRDWGPYLLTVAGTALVTIGAPVAVLGAVLPYLLRVVQGSGQAPGEAIGRLVAVNTVGAIAGALAGGFVVLPLLGARQGLVALAAAYPAMALVVLATRASLAGSPARRRTRAPGPVLAGVAVLVVVVLPVGDLTAATTRPGERLLELREGPDANVAVVRDTRRDLAIRVNTTYTLGGTSGLGAERNQAVIPLLAHPGARSVFFLGLGTGITAGAALAFPLERVVACELIRDVVDVSRSHFSPWTNGLFVDPRAEVTAADGRSCLLRSEERFDLIISDLFVPWHAGTAALYTREHYEQALERLTAGGAFVQWLPLYQVSERELGIIARTMDQVFDQVVAWRGDLFDERSVLALVGHRDPEPLDPGAVAPAARAVAAAAGNELPDELGDDALAAMVLRLYAGNISAGEVYASRELNTDSHPLIEHLTPRTHRAVRAGRAEFVVGEERQRVYRRLAAATDPVDDPYLAELDDAQLDWVRAGLAYSEHRVAAARGLPARAERQLRIARGASPTDSLQYLSPASLLLPRELDGR